MNMFEAMRLVGKYPVVEGFWRCASFVIGIIGIMIFLLVAGLFWKTSIPVWLVILLVTPFAVMATLPIYLPRAEEKPKNQKEVK